MFATPFHSHRKEQQIFLIAILDKDYNALVGKGDESVSELMKFQDVDTTIIYLNEISNNTNHPCGLPSFIMIDSRHIEKEIVSIIRKLKSDTRFRMIPLVVMVSTENQEIANQYYAAGASSCLPIPDDPQKFSTLLKLTRDYWLRIVTLPTSKNIY